MSLRHSLLAILTAEDMTGYDLVKYFDGTVAYVWSAPNSQIYPELRRMEADGLIEATEVPRGQKATKRVYSITPAGRTALRSWANEVHTFPPERDLTRLKAAYIEWGSYETARRQLEQHLAHWTAVKTDWGRMVSDIESEVVPLLVRRLESRPDEERDATIAFKRFAFRGALYRADAEIAWANEGLELLDQLESQGAQLAGDDR